MKFQTNKEMMPDFAAQGRYEAARAGLERAQADRTEAVCRFLEARAQLRIAEFPDADVECLFAGTTDGSEDRLAQADAELRQAKILYCAALEQNCLLQRIVSQLRVGYLRAQEKLERLAMEESYGSDPQSAGHYENTFRTSRSD